MVNEKQLKGAIKKLNKNKKIERVWNRFKIARRIAKRNGKKLSIDVFNKMLEEENL